MKLEERRAADPKIKAENLFKSLGAGEQEAETEGFQCGRCKQVSLRLFSASSIWRLRSANATIIKRNEEYWRADGGNHSTVHSSMLIMTVSLQKNIRDVSGLRPDHFSNPTSLSSQMCQLWKQVGNPLLSPPHCSDHILQMRWKFS